MNKYLKALIASASFAVGTLIAAYFANSISGDTAYAIYNQTLAIFIYVSLWEN